MESENKERADHFEHTDYFDLSLLLKLDDLCTQKFAVAEPSIMVGQYFNKLSEFLQHAPFVLRALKKFANRDGDKKDYKNIDTMINMLESLGCRKFTIAFHSVLNTYGKIGNWREAAAHAKQIVEEFDGFTQQIVSARVEKKPDTLPEATLPLNELIRQLENEKSNRQLVILAVDDSPVILNSVSHVLGEEYKVFTLPKPTELEKVLQKLTPDLFLLDYKMPEINGFELIPIIRSFETHKETPIIFLTSEGTVDTVTAAIAVGARDFIVKPFKPEILREKIAKHIIPRPPQN